MSTNHQINILHICPSFAVGGAEALILGLAECHDQSRYNLHMMSIHRTKGRSLQPEFERLGVAVHALDARRFYDLRSVQAMVQYIRRHQIDVVHTHLMAADILGRIAARIAGVPVVSTLQNEPHSFTIRRRDRQWLQKLTARYLTTQLVTVSQGVRDKFVQDWGIAADRIKMIYNAVPMEQYLQVPEQSSVDFVGDHPVITNVGRLYPQKAQHLLLEAAQQVLRQRPDAQFLIVGRGVLEAQLKAQAQQLGIADSVVFTGVRRDIPDILAQSDIFVLSSLWEGLPLSAVEAMAAARPVVLTDVGGNSELVASGVQGLIVPPNDVPALSNALLTLIDDATRRRAMGLAGRARVRYDFSVSNITHQYECLYEQLVQARPEAVTITGTQR